MNILDPILQSVKWALDAGFRYTLKRVAALPIAVAQSAKLMRIVTLTGMAILSVALLSITIHLVEVNEVIKGSEDLNKNIGLDIKLRLSSALKVAEATEWLIKNNRLSDNPENISESIQSLPWIMSAEVLGVAFISDKGVSVLYGKLDPSFNSSNWDRIRWEQLRNRTSTELKGSEPVTLFLGIERLFRTKDEFQRGQQLAGSLVLSRAWRKDTNSWEGVVILLPVQSFNSLLRLGADQYESGNYDYLVDSDGFLLAHPSPFLVYGTDSNGRDLRGASNYDEVGKFPINTRDSDWIAGNDTINQAFGSMINHQAKTVVYKNLKNQPRLTSFRLVELNDIKGKPFGVVTGRGLNKIEAFTIPIFLKRSATLSSILWATAGIYLFLVSGWLALVSKFRSLHIDLLAWSRFMSPTTASTLGLLPIPKGEIKDFNFSNMVAIVLSLNLDKLSRKERYNTLDLFAELCARLQEDGWITHIWSFRSVVACRPLTDAVSNGKMYLWSPINVADYLRNLDDFQVLRGIGNESNTLSYRVIYGIGELHIKAGRLGSMQRANISVFGNSILNSLHINEDLNISDPSSHGVLMYPIEEAIDAGLQAVGDKVIVNSRTYCKLQLTR